MARDYAKRKINSSSSRSHQDSRRKKRMNKIMLLFMLLVMSIAAIFIWLVYGTHDSKQLKYLPVFLSKKIQAHTKTQSILSSKSAKKITQNALEPPVRFDFYTELSHNPVVLSKNVPIKQVQVDEVSTTRQLQLSKLSMLLDDEYHKKANNK